MLSLTCNSEDKPKASEQNTYISSFYDENGRSFQELFEDITKVIICNTNLKLK